MQPCTRRRFCLGCCLSSWAVRAIAAQPCPGQAALQRLCRPLMKQKLIVHNYPQKCWQSISENVDKSRLSAFRTSALHEEVSVAVISPRVRETPCDDF